MALDAAITTRTIQPVGSHRFVIRKLSLGDPDDKVVPMIGE